MNSLARSISQIFKGAVGAFETFPASIACALGFSIVTIIRIHLDWPEQEAWNFMFNCLHWSLALGAIFSLAAITAAKSLYDQKKAFWIANAFGVAVTASTFAVLYLMSGTESAMTATRYATISGIAEARVSMAMLVCFLAFVVLAGLPKEHSDFSRSFFMTHKAFFIASIYGIVIMSGTSGVAGAVQALLYRDMSEKVYMYIATLAGFLAYTIFLGYFPDFARKHYDERREAVQKQPRFIEILFVYIMIPIVLALTVVLLLWAGRTIVTGSWPVFSRLASIATAYTLGGVWLHIMVTHHESGIAGFYRKVYPLAALVILAFEAWALVVQIGREGLKIDSYSFALLWIVGVAAAAMLFLIKAKAHLPIVVLVCLLAFVSVLPAVGYHALPVSAQVDRLENILTSQGMFEDGKIVPAVAEPEKEVRQSITDAVSYLAGARDAKLPEWFDRNLSESMVFKSKFGFEQIWPEPEDYNGGEPTKDMGVHLYRPANAVDISGYEWAVGLMENYRAENEYVAIAGSRGTYQIYWTVKPPEDLPTLKILLDGNEIVNQSMDAYIDMIQSKYPPGGGQPKAASFEDMSLMIETPEISALLVFTSVDINVNTQEDYISYWLYPDKLYIREK